MLQLANNMFNWLSGFSVDCVECLWMTTLDPTLQALLEAVFDTDTCVTNANTTSVVTCAAEQTCLMYGGQMPGTYTVIIGKSHGADRSSV